MAPTHDSVNRNHVQSTRDSPIPNGRVTPMEVDNGNRLTITASLSESPRFTRRNQPVNPSDQITVSPRPGDPPTTHTILKQGNGAHPPNYQGTVNRQADVLGTITISDEKDICKPVRPIPQHHTLQLTVFNQNDSKNYTFDVELEYRVEKLMDMIYDRLYIAIDQQILTYAGKNLVKGMTLGHYKIKEHQPVLLTTRASRLNLRGG